MAYLADAPIAEWSCAVAACLFAALSILSIEGLRAAVSRIQTQEGESMADVLVRERSGAISSRHWLWGMASQTTQLMLLALGWAALTPILSVPTVVSHCCK